MKKIITLTVLLAAALILLSACKESEEEYPGLSHLVELTNTLATTYNEVAETAINNGWEYDDETVAEMDKIATVIDTINEKIVAPETFADGQIQVLTESAKEFTKTLETIEKRVKEEYVPPETAEETPAQ